MMREIVQINIGQCGNSIGCKFWEDISNEHGIEYDTGTHIKSDNKELNKFQLDRINVYYDQVDGDRYIPRSIFIELEQPEDTSIDTIIKSSKINKLFKNENLITSKEYGAKNNFARGYYTDGMEILDNVLDVIRLEVENCDNLQGFQMNHSIGGGTGSGFTSLLLSNLKDEYPDRLMSTFTILPSPTTPTIVEPYNAIFSLNHLIELADQVICIDNQELLDLFLNKFKIQPNYPDMNNLISSIMSNITSNLRFPNQLNNDLFKLSLNLMIPDNSRLHFLSPISTTNTTTNEQLSLQQLFNNNHGKLLNACAIFRGEQFKSQNQIEEELFKISNNNNNIKSTFYNITSPTFKFQQSATLLSNNTGIKDAFKRILTQFDALYKRKAFLSFYIKEGMDESEIINSQSNVNNLINEYQQFMFNTTTTMTINKYSILFELIKKREEEEEESISSNNHLLFFKIWRNKSIREEINYHKRLYNENLNKSFKTCKQLNKYKYKSYITSLTLLGIDDGDEYRDDYNEIGDIFLKNNSNNEDDKIINTIKSLKFNNKFNQILKINQLPLSLESLYFNKMYDKPIIESDIIPSSITDLEYSHCTKLNQLLPNVIPKSVTKLKFDDSFNCKLSINSIPLNVTHLTFGIAFNQILEKGDIPENCKYLKFGICYNQPLIPFQSIPNSITTIHFGLSFSQQLKYGDIPLLTNNIIFENKRKYDHNLIYQNKNNNNNTNINLKNNEVINVL